ncbi:hypothetical protein LOTGIDRAFT_205122 [Lottia gigantea]|uniref:UDP-N-acetylglucosamine transferase subunit ALG13 n=1 Tax=Lottia gigantea TaxID=225164 RepID=V4AWK7_LOTGI|nr:hypothetical protein LOTGIDRAFT_205122 [Lottia gigantea]ESP01848.1 hypothetical protein LOTGIDRAFT_205122 [Lottia gigantea]
MSDKKVFVTVGTTQFDELIHHVSSSQTVEVLKKLGYTELMLQIGNGTEPDIPDVKNFDIEYYQFKNSLEEDIQTASLVISHAGSGSIMDVLGAKKPLLVVINEKLMDNHQYEVAEKFADVGYLYYCTTSKLVETLESVNFTDLKPYVPGDPYKFASVLDNIMGFSLPKS